MRSATSSAIPGVSFIYLLALFLVACSHKYDSNTLDLTFYQWNKWHDISAHAGHTGDYHPPSVGWEALDRGVGELVRIPSVVEDTGGVIWYHCRFTLPEEWQDTPIYLEFEGVTPVAQVYLNEALVGSIRHAEVPVEIEVSEPVNYTLDNHLAIRVIWKPDSSADHHRGVYGSPATSGWGVTERIMVKSLRNPEASR
jgi:hypothetical protein